MIDYGLLENLGIDPRAYIRSPKVPYIYYNESGDWTEWLPKYEPQAEHYETYACTVWASLNQLETFHNFLYSKEPNYAERFNALLIGMTLQRGGDPQKAHESIRKDGVVDQEYCPIPRTKTEFLDRGILTGSLLARGQYWLTKHDYFHDWLWSDPKERPADWKELLKDALKTSPLAVSVSAWNEENGVYVSYGDVNNHYCMLYNIDEEGYMYVFDSYDHSRKKLSKDHNIRRAKRIWLNKKTMYALVRHRHLLQSILKSLQIMKPDLLDVCEAWLGKDATPDDLVPDVVACAITVSTLINKVDATFPKVAGTYTLLDILSHRKDYMRVTEPTPETIIICATEPGHPFPGHVGIYMDDMTIASNDSKTGKFIKNYTTQTWRDRWEKKGGYTVHMFKKK
jgi:hypothetical protein